MSSDILLREFFEYWFGDTVYLITDKEQVPRMIIEIVIKPNGCIYYGIVGGTENSAHYDFELSSEINLMLKTDS